MTDEQLTELNNPKPEGEEGEEGSGENGSQGVPTQAPPTSGLMGSEPVQP